MAGIRPDVLAAAAEERGFSSLHIAEHSHIPVSRAAANCRTCTTGPWTRSSRCCSNATSSTRRKRSLRWTWSREAGSSSASDGTGRKCAITAPIHAPRGALVDEQLAALKEIWTKDEAEFHGEHIDFDPIFAWPKPVQKPHPPIFIGGAGQKAMERIAKYGDGWLPHAHTPPEELRRARQWLADKGRSDLKFSAFGTTPEEDALGRLAEGGVDEATLFLPTEPEAATLERLDQFAKVVESFRKGQQA